MKGFNDNNREGFSNEKYAEDVERKYNYDDAYNKNDDYETKNRRKDFYRMKPSDDDDEKMRIRTRITIRTFARRKRRRGKQSPI